MKPLRKVKLKPKDPDWTFPYATRACLERIREYFEGFQKGLHPQGWRLNKNTHALKKSDGTPFASVLPHLRPKVIAWFEMMLARERAKKIAGWPSPGKVRSLRMNAAHFGRNVLTGRRRANKSVYDRRKRIWLAFQEWENRKQFVDREVERPHTSSKLLELG